MRLLTIDVGNTNTEFAFFADGNLEKTWRLSTDRRRTSDEYSLFLRHMLSLSGLDEKGLDAAILSCVVPDAVFPLRQLCRRDLNIPVTVLGSDELDLGISVGIEGDVGADRLVNAAEAWQRYKVPLIVVDFGTATTFDVVGRTSSGAGTFLGGVIAPGVNLSLEALGAAAAKLPAIRVRRPEKVIGTATIPAMESGVFYGYLGLVDGIAGRIVKEYGSPMKVIATGGLASLYTPFSETIDETVEDLTIRGLYTIYTSNR